MNNGASCLLTGNRNVKFLLYRHCRAEPLNLKQCGLFVWVCKLYVAIGILVLH